MAIALSQSDYWNLVQKNIADEQTASTPDSADITWHYPAQLGHGSIREIRLREGLVLAIADYQLHQDLIVEVPEREHPLEYEFTVVQEHPQQSCFSEHYFFSGGGLAESSIHENVSGWQVLDVSFHLEAELFRLWMGDRLEHAPPLRELVNPLKQDRYTHEATPTMAMRAVVQQVLNCPYTDMTRQIYLESKVWELVSLHLEQMLHPLQNPPQPSFKPDDIDRLHHARKILSQHLNNPPSLKGLARQVGLNEFTLKQGFRTIFGTTVFGCLHHYCMERARALLEAGSLNVSEVAREVGFANRGYFAAAFRKKFGTNPKAYSLVAKQQIG
ncbi:helix-turn-helix transcriptional regulator [Leptolyngbya sp. FACHB-671]|uniref:helix-turn-helix transcriptional regulator n=1 Tax=Leptolyngbya sp. FACHB-671 TaxID=2692812 RepID=UPI00168468FD|nr:AraC family transcriptional regulator [Leptolyngbya sp. FACHB-671]MBD2068744.1 helix-turn-helix transcriptional regulator [Leptolyngbya sp. FACHB-671]